MRNREEESYKSNFIYVAFNLCMILVQLKKKEEGKELCIR